MARGYPDYFGQRSTPKYGTPFHYTPGAVTLPAGTTTDLLTVLGQGVIISATVFMGPAFDAASGIFTATIDNVEKFSRSVWWMWYKNHVYPSNFVYRLTQYDSANGYYTIESQHVIPFSLSYKLQLHNGLAVDNFVYPEVFYYLQQ